MLKYASPLGLAAVAASDADYLLSHVQVTRRITAKQTGLTVLSPGMPYQQVIVTATVGQRRIGGWLSRFPDRFLIGGGGIALTEE